MTGPTGREREPDPAALDELEQAFGGAPPDPGAGAEQDDSDRDGGATQPYDSADPPSEALLIVEAEPLASSGGSADEAAHGPVGGPAHEQAREAPEDPVVEPAQAQSVIRIDDYSGSFVIDGQSERPAGAVGSIGAGRPTIGVEPIVIEIDDADLPDTVYIEGSLDPSESRSIVIIEDDDTGDALVPESDRDIRRGIEPRMRERRVAVKRAQGRKRLKWVALGVLVVVLVVGVLAVLGSGLFAIQDDQVFVTGNVYTDPDLLQEVIDDLVGTPVLLVDTQGAERRIEAIPWVDVARVHTDFPHGVTIEIRERQAIATYQGPDQRFRVLDREGRVLDVIDLYPIAYLLLDGPDPVDLDPGEFAPRGYAAAAELAKNLTGSVRGNVERLDVTADGSRLVMFLVDGTEVRFGEARDLFAKLVRLETVLGSGDARQPGVIDVSTNEVTL